MNGEDVSPAFLKSLLAVSTRLQSETSEVATCETEKKQLSEEDKEWLQKAFVEIVNETDPSKNLDKVLDGLTSVVCIAKKGEMNEEDSDATSDLAGHLGELLDHADLAPKFVNKGGLNIISVFLSLRSRPALQSQFAEIVAILTENNPIAQAAVAKQGLLRDIIELIADSSQNVRTRIRLLTSLSASVRSFDPAFDAFVELNGPSTIESVIAGTSANGAEDEELQFSAKALRVLTSIAFNAADSRGSIPLLQTGEFSAERASLLKESIVRGYVNLFAELETVREYLRDSVRWEELPEELRKNLVQSVALERTRVTDEENSLLLARLAQKFASLKED